MPATARSIESDALDTLGEFERDPVRFVREVIGAEPEPWQADTLRALVTGTRIAIRSGHGVGKSAMMAWTILWWLCTHYPAKVACTAPTAHQLYDVLWSECAQWLRKMPAQWRDSLEWKADRIELKGAASESFAVARTARKEQPEALQGFHARHMLFLIDEASGVDDLVFEVAEGAMSTPGAKTLMVGNPTRTSGFFYEAFHKARAHWNVRRVGCGESSRVDPDFVLRMRERYGADSNVYRVRVEGEFPTSEDDVVVPLHLCEAAAARKVDMTGSRVIWGVDVARFGNDDSALAKRCGNSLLEKVKTWHGLDTMQVAGKVMAEYRAAEHKPDVICVDSIGIGAGVVDRLGELGLPAIGVNVAETPSVEPERFMRLRDQLWFGVREWLERRDCAMPDDPDLIGELSSVKYKLTSAGKLQVESKEDMKKRGMSSPDRGDSVCLTFAASDLRGQQASYAAPTYYDS